MLQMANHVYCRWNHIFIYIQVYVVFIYCLSQAFVDAVSNSEDTSRFQVLADTKEEFHLYMSPTMMSDNGEYHCLYKTRYVLWTALSAGLKVGYFLWHIISCVTTDHY